MKKFIVAFLLMVMMVAGIEAAADKSDVLQKGDIVGQELRQVGVDKHKITNFKGDRIFVRVKPDISGKDDLSRYVNQRIATIKYLSSTQSGRIVDVVITFNDGISVEEYNTFMSQYGLNGLNFMFKSYPEGTGVLSSEIPPEKIEKMEEPIRQKYEDFRLVDKVVSVKTQMPAEDLLKVQNDERVFLVDAGPLEVYKNNPSKEINVATDYIYPNI